MSGHDVRIDGDVVHKRYRHTDHDELNREWSALVLLERHAPGLAPRPLAYETEPPGITMTRLYGVPLDSVVTSEQTTAMLKAYRLLFAVPVQSRTPLRHGHPEAFVRNNVEWIEEQHERTDLSDAVRDALTRARSWHAAAPPGIDQIRNPVIAQGDAKADNMIWDGSRVGLIDFEGFGVGDLAFEVADLAEHISARLPALRDPEVVVAAFDLSDEQLDRAAAYRIVLASFWLLMLLPGNPGNPLNPAGSDEAQAKHLISLLDRASEPSS